MSLTNATIDEIRAFGRDMGRFCASWVDMPKPGQKVSRDLDWNSLGIDSVESLEDAAEAFTMLAHAGEEHQRQYSPFEFYAHEMNERDDADDAWGAYEEGVSDGIAESWQERASYYDANDFPS